MSLISSSVHVAAKKESSARRDRELTVHGMLRTLLLAAVAARGACVSVPPAPTTAVFGHKIPDTDAICAALAYEWELEARGMPARAYRLGELNRETEYVLNALGVDVPPLLDGALEPGAPVAVVDTNNPGELPEGIENAAVHSVIDHHKLTGLRTVAPLEVDMRPLCSAGSIIYARAKAAGRSVPKRIAGLLLSCILSDSLEFRSPTTTPETHRLSFLEKAWIGASAWKSLLAATILRTLSNALLTSHTCATMPRELSSSDVA